MGYFLDVRKLEFRLVVDELITNAIVHGNERQEEKHVSIVLDIDAERLELQIQDEGNGFDFSTIPDPRDPENLVKSSGRGILLCKMYMDRLDYNEKGNQVIAIAYARTRGPLAGPDTHMQPALIAH